MHCDAISLALLRSLLPFAPLPHLARIPVTEGSALPSIDAPRAVLVGVQLPRVSEAELASSLDELARLAATLGLVPVARLTQHRPGTGAVASSTG